jgi:ADP-heptose:LPS heptosyltransferase
MNTKKIIICKNVKPLKNGKRNPKDYPYWDELIDLLKGHSIYILNVDLPLDDLEALILDSDFFVSIDSFFQHFAWSVGKRGAVIFSVTDPLIFGHKTNINIIKNRSFLRKNQFLFMEQEPYNVLAFESPENVYGILQSNFL